jgi:hypothetical protein
MRKRVTDKKIEFVGRGRKEMGCDPRLIRIAAGLGDILFGHVYSRLGEVVKTELEAKLVGMKKMSTKSISCMLY